MNIRNKKLIQIGKLTLVCIFILLIAVLEFISPTSLQTSENFDLSSAALISIGAASSISLGINSRKKV